MKKIILAGIIVLISGLANAQQLFQDASGNTQIPVGKQNIGFLFYNTSDKSATVGYSHSNTNGGYDTDWEADRVYGLDLKIKTSDGIGNFFNKNTVNPGFTLSGNFGYFKDNWLQKHHYLNFSVKGQIGYNQYAYIHTAAPDYKIDKAKKVEAGLLFNIGSELNLTPNAGSDTMSVIFVSLQTGFRKMNNYDDLDDGQITTISSQSVSTNISTAETGKLGVYESYNVMPLNIDLAYTPRLFKTNYIGVNTYLRTNFFKKVNTTNVGFGLYLADPKKPSQISGGIGWQFNDLSNKLGKDTDLMGRSIAFFYVGYAIGAK